MVFDDSTFNVQWEEFAIDLALLSFLLDIATRLGPECLLSGELANGDTFSLYLNNWYGYRHSTPILF